MLAPLFNKRKRLFTLEEFSAETGIPVAEIEEMEKGVLGFFTENQRKYVNTLRWRLMVTPEKRNKYYKQKGLPLPHEEDAD